jgi:hypothetical protein
MLHFEGLSAMGSLRKYHEPKYTWADIMRQALAEILRKAHVTDGQTQYCIEPYKLFHLRGIRVYETSGSDFRVWEEESGMAWLARAAISKFKIELKLKSSLSRLIPFNNGEIPKFQPA